MSKEQYITKIKTTIARNGVLTQEQLAKSMFSARWFSLRETYYVMKELIDYRQVKYTQDDIGRYTFYAN